MWSRAKTSAEYRPRFLKIGTNLSIFLSLRETTEQRRISTSSYSYLLEILVSHFTKQTKKYFGWCCSWHTAQHSTTAKRWRIEFWGRQVWGNKGWLWGFHHFLGTFKDVFFSQEDEDEQGQLRWNIRYTLRSHYDSIRALQFHPVEVCNFQRKKCFSLFKAYIDNCIGRWNCETLGPQSFCCCRHQGKRKWWKR